MNRVTLLRGVLRALVALSAIFAVACKTPPGAGEAGASAASAASATAAPDASSGAPYASESEDDEIRPVYPIDNQPPLPDAQRYCDAVKELPKKRQLECCPSSPAFAMTSECVRTLSAALRSGAVTLGAAELDACVSAVTKETADCDWVASTGSPTVLACLGIIKGSVKVGARCRSNLECEEGLRCLGLGATRQGRCTRPLPPASGCGVGVDSLASFSGQDDVDRHHPECDGWCARRRCKAAIAIGGACTASAECGAKARCIAGKCSDGPLPNVGEACTDVCAAGARCAKAKCIAVHAGGDTCTENAECRSRCERADGGKTGRCTADCPASFFKPPSSAR